MSLQQQLYDILTSNKSFDETKYIIDTLINYGGDIHKPLTNKGEYAFHAIIKRVFKSYAIDTDLEKICEYLLQLCCNINALNNDNETPFYYLCSNFSRNYKTKHFMIEYLLESGSIMDYSERFGKKDLLRMLNDETLQGRNTYSDIFDSKLETFILEYWYIIDYCLYSSLISFKYILRNRIIDIKHLLLKYAEHKIFEYTDEEYFYDDDKFDYKTTYWYMVNEEHSQLEFKKDTLLKAYFDERNKSILHYIEDSLNYWSPVRHYIQPTCVRNAVWCILLIQNKINQVEKHPLFLPPELWFHICSFFTQEMWIVIANKTIPIHKFTRIPNLPCLL